MRISKKIGAVVFSLIMILGNFNEVTAFAQNAETVENIEIENQKKKKPEISLNYSKGFAIGQSYTFGVISDLSGLVSVSLESEDGSMIVVTSEEVMADKEKIIKIDKMPNATTAKLVVIVKPENDDFSDLSVSQLKEYELSSTQKIEVFQRNVSSDELEIEEEELENNTTYTDEPELEQASKEIEEEEVVSARVSQDLIIKKQPKKVEYYVNELVPSEKDLLLGSVIQFKNEVGNYETIFLTQGVQEGYSTNYKSIKDTMTQVAGGITLEIYYKGKVAEITFTLVDVEIQSLEILKYPNKTTYQIGEDLNLDGLQVIAKKNNGATTKPLIEHVDYEVDKSLYNKNNAELYELSIVGKGEYAEKKDS